MPTTAPPVEADAVIIGAGPGGIASAHLLQQKGIHDFVIVDRGDDFGGTWRDNHYPGLAVDIPSLWYQLSFAPNPDWSRFFAPGPEIYAYLRDTADKLGLRPHLRAGAEVLRQPVHPWVFNVRASYFAETEMLAGYMTEELGLRRIALLMQDDSFGESAKSGLAGALHQRDLKLQAEARFLRNSLEVGDALERLRAVQPQAIFFVGTYKQLAAAIRQARAKGMKARFFSVSFVGTESFIAEAGPLAEDVLISQVVPSPEDVSLPLVRDYRADMAGSPMGYTSLEGYINAAVLVEALRRAGPQPTRARLVKELSTLDIDLGGFRVTFGPNDHQGSDAVFLTRIEQGRAVPVQRQP